VIIADFWSKGLGTFVTNSFGSDEFLPYSAEYSWLANQMAHAMMGFCIAAIWVQLGKRWYWPYVIAPAKAPIDYLVSVGFAQGHFRPPAWEFWFDKATDVFFWSFGMTLAVAIFATNSWWGAHRKYKILGTVAVGVTGSLLLGQWWVRQKDAFDSSEIPNSYVRLCNFEKGGARLIDEKAPTGNGYEILDRYVETIEQPAPAGTHLVIIGGDATHRTRLALALGCEHTARVQLAYYTTLTKALEDPARIDQFMQDVARPKKDQGCPLRCVILDDVNTLMPMPSLTPEERHRKRQSLNALRLAEQWTGASVRHVLEYQVKLDAAVEAQFRHLREGHVSSIWVLSGHPEDEEARERIDGWIGAIQQLLGADETTLKVVRLLPVESAAPSKRFRARRRQAPGRRIGRALLAR
jgi:hypothetical protein